MTLVVPQYDMVVVILSWFMKMRSHSLHDIVNHIHDSLVGRCSTALACRLRLCFLPRVGVDGTRFNHIFVIVLLGVRLRRGFMTDVAAGSLQVLSSGCGVGFLGGAGGCHC